MTFSFIRGATNRAAGTLNAFRGLSAALEAEGFPAMVSRSGDREPEEQLRIWHERMVLSPGARRVYGTKVWQGKKWFRIHPDTVATPDSGNHVKRRANDLIAPYNNATSPAHKRAQVLAPRFGITWEGKGFKEPWHWTYWGPLGAIAPAGSVAGGVEVAPKPEPEPKEPAPVDEEDDMRAVKKSGVPHSGIIVQAGVPPYAVDDQVYDALRGAYGLVSRELADWQYETVIREQWAAFGTAQAFAADKSLSQGDVDRVASAVRDALT